MAVNHATPGRTSSTTKVGGRTTYSRSAIDSLVAFYRTIALQEGELLNFSSLQCSGQPGKSNFCIFTAHPSHVHSAHERIHLKMQLRSPCNHCEYILTGEVGRQNLRTKRVNGFHGEQIIPSLLRNFTVQLFQEILGYCAILKATLTQALLSTNICVIQTTS